MNALFFAKKTTTILQVVVVLFEEVRPVEKEQNHLDVLRKSGDIVCERTLNVCKT